MKNFIKKYPKRIITAALVVLLIAVVGTVNNYRTYWDARERECYIEDETIEFMQEIYGHIRIVSGRWLYYGDMNLEKHDTANSVNEDFIEMYTDAAKYSPEDVVTVTIENKLFNDVTFYPEKYVLQIERIERGVRRRFTVHSGEINTYDTNEYVTIGDGEKYEMEIPLTSVREVSDEPVTLIPGRYRLSLPIFVVNKVGIGQEDKVLACEFTIK